MIKTILVPAAGTLEESVLDTALMAAETAGAHVDLLYFRGDLVKAIESKPYLEFAFGGAISPALAALDMESEQQSATARSAFASLCERRGVALRDEPAAPAGVTAAWREERGAPGGLAFHARHCDLVVMGRPGPAGTFATGDIEAVLFGSGRPLLVAPALARPSMRGTAMVCWKETPQSARAVSAALPLLRQAARVVVIHVEEGEADGAGANEVVRQLARHGIEAQARSLAAQARATADVLADAVDANEADLIVLGAYGRSRVRERVFGGCTRAFLERAGVPVLMMH
ncbi:MAG TPA: universal stress protein [Xanthobacteraceae bacterium]